MGDYAAFAVIGGFILVFFLVFLVIFIFFLLSLQKALNLTGEENREMSPGLVWLNLIPIFNLGWMVYTVIKVSEAINKKHLAHNVVDPSQGSKMIGLLYAIAIICSIIPFIGGLFGLAGLVLFIIYWINIANYNKAMTQMA